MFGSTCLKFGRLKAYKTASPAQRETYLNLTFTIQQQSTDPVYMTSLINFLKSKMAESHAVMALKALRGFLYLQLSVALLLWPLKAHVINMEKAVLN